jgi:hypothetical protein
MQTQAFSAQRVGARRTRAPASGRRLTVQVNAANALIVNTKGGGHAFIGLYLAKELMGKGHKVTILNDGDEVWRAWGLERDCQRPMLPCLPNAGLAARGPSCTCALRSWAALGSELGPHGRGPLAGGEAQPLAPGAPRRLHRLQHNPHGPSALPGAQRMA